MALHPWPLLISHPDGARETLQNALAFRFDRGRGRPAFHDFESEEAKESQARELDIEPQIFSDLVRQFDTAEQAADFDSGKILSDSLIGNINIYPLALDNTSWHDSVEFNSPKDAPVLEIRFMGLPVTPAR